jgi:hypothetical protein
MPEEHTVLRIKTAVKDRLNKSKHELYVNSFKDAVNAPIGE